MHTHTNTPLTFNSLSEDNSRVLDPKNRTNDTTTVGTVKLVPSMITFSAKKVYHTYSDTLIALVEGVDHHNNYYFVLYLQSDQRFSQTKKPVTTEGPLGTFPGSK